MKRKSKILQIIAGIFTAILVWGSAPLFAGVFVFGDILDFADTEVLPFVYPLFFCAVLIAVGFFAGKKNKPSYFKSMLISLASPAGFGLLFWIVATLGTLINGSFASPFAYLGLPLALPMSVVEGMVKCLNKFGLKSYDIKTMVIVIAAMVIPIIAGFIVSIVTYKKHIPEI